MERIILASASPRRRELLERAHVEFDVIPARGEEIITETGPAEIVMQLSLGKAGEIARMYDGTLVIGADTIVVYGGRVLGKPSDPEDAVRMLTLLQGNTHQVYTGVSWYHREGGSWKTHSFYECTDVVFYPVPQDKILEYVNSGEPMDKAGAYGIQGEWGIHVKGICGDYNNVVGLPVARLFYEAGLAGIDLTKR